VETEYTPCECSPLGKVWRVSQPHAPNATSTGRHTHTTCWAG
jgi:hypothetical protein